MQKPFTTQSELFVSTTDINHPILPSLDDTEALLDWAKLEHVLSSVYSSKTGRPSYPLLSLFRGLLLGIWYQLSDVQLAQCLYRDLLFRKFCRFELVGNEVDGSPKRDPEAGWHSKNNSRGIKKSTYGYSVHTGVDEDGFIHRQSVTAGNVHDSQERDMLLLGDETALYADAAYSSAETSATLKRFGIDDQVQRRAYRNRPLSCADDELRNQVIAVTRSGGERPFATYKQHYGLARTRFMGLAKNATMYGLAAIAANIRKGAKFLASYGLAEPSHTG